MRLHGAQRERVLLPAGPLPLDDDPRAEASDPYLDAAKGIVEAKVFEREVERILDQAGAVGPIRDRLKFEAMQFGSTLDLDAFAKYAYENVEALPVEMPMEDVIGEFGGEG